MKRIWLVMLSLGLVLAFSASAFAVDVKFSGSFYAAGLYLDKVTLRDNVNGEPADSSSGVSTAFYYQRLRVQTDFIVSPGLTLITRFDALERIWGARRNVDYEDENIKFDWAYIDYVSPIGTFDVGYMEHGVWGTIFYDTSYNGGAIKWAYTAGPVKVGLKVNKGNYASGENSYYYANTATNQSDKDNDAYSGYVKYAAKNVEAGLLVKYGRNATLRTAALSSTSASSNFTKSYTLNPYAKAKFGPVSIEAELAYAWGTKHYEDDYFADVYYSNNFGAYIDAVADFGKVYAGASGAYISGDDPTTTNKVEGGLVHAGDWDPCLIMFNSERATWVGSLAGYDNTHSNPFIGEKGDNSYSGYGTTTSTAPGAWFLQGRVGVRPTDKLDIVASLSWAEADHAPAYVLDEHFGWETDITATYSITNNLSYMVGAGYLWTGDYYQGYDQEQDINDNYLFINKLTLTF